MAGYWRSRGHGWTRLGAIEALGWRCGKRKNAGGGTGGNREEALSMDVREHRIWRCKICCEDNDF